MSDAPFRFAQNMRALLGDRVEWIARHAVNDLVTERGKLAAQAVVAPADYPAFDANCIALGIYPAGTPVALDFVTRVMDYSEADNA